MRVAVVGSGTAGAAAALLLHARGVNVCVFERVPEPSPIGAGILLQPSGMAVLEELGLLQEVRARGATIEQLRGVTTTGRTVLDIAYRTRRSDLFGLGTHRGSLFAALYGAVLARGIRVQTGTEVVGLEESTDGWALVGADGVQLGSFDLVVVADGARSTLRDRAGVTSRARQYPYGALWFVAEDREQLFAKELFQVYRGTQHMLGFLPTGYAADGSGPYTSVFWSLPVANAEEMSVEQWRNHVLAMCPHAKPLVDQIKTRDELVLAVYHDVVMRRPWQQASNGAGAIVIGDAAHAMSPQLGQGANLALLDAASLVGALEQSGALVDRAKLAAALQRFTRSRLGPVGAYQFFSRWLTPAFQSNWSILGVLRDAFMGLICKTPPFRSFILNILIGSKTGLLSASEPPRLGSGAGARSSDDA